MAAIPLATFTDAETRTAEEARRKNLALMDVAQEAIDCLAELTQQQRSSSEVFTVYGYSLSHVLKPALLEERRIVQELKSGPADQVVSTVLDVAAVKAKHNVPDFVQPGPPE